MKNKTVRMMVTMVMVGTLMMGCGSGSDRSTAAGSTSSAASSVTEEENYDTGDASLDNVRNQDDIGESEILVSSFGTSYNDNRRLTIGGIEDAIENTFPDYAVRRGFTSQIIIDHVKKRDHVAIDNMEEALQRAADNGVKTLVVQPTHLMDGLEYKDVEKEVVTYSDAFEKVVIGKPLLTSDEDYDRVIEALAEDMKKYADDETAVCLMGHGTEAASNEVYAKMQRKLREAGYEHYYVGTVEASPTLADVIETVKKGNYKKVVLRPLMVVAGDHANNDMAGDEDSWKTAFEQEGYQVTCVLEGLGQLNGIQMIYVDHIRDAIESIK